MSGEDDGLLRDCERPDRTLAVHGHGTGAVRNAVRETLANHPLVLNARKGNDTEGGNGVTVVTLRG